MAIITNRNTGTRGRDIISLNNPEDFAKVFVAERGPTVIIWGGGGNDVLSSKVTSPLHHWLYGDDTLFQPGTPRIGGPAGDDILNLGGGWWGTGLGGADTFWLHGGHYDRARNETRITDFDPFEGDKIIADHSDGFDIDAFRFIAVQKDTDRAGGLTGVLRALNLDFRSDDPVTGGQEIDIRLADQGDGGHRNVWLEWGGRGEAPTQRAAMLDFIEDGGWLL